MSCARSKTVCGKPKSSRLCRVTKRGHAGPPYDRLLIPKKRQIMLKTHTMINEATQRSASARTIMVIAIALVVIGVMSAFGRTAIAQQLSQRDVLARFAQSGGNDAASLALKMGRDYLDDQQWLKAQQKFNEYVTSYPSDKKVD